MSKSIYTHTHTHTHTHRCSPKKRKQPVNETSINWKPELFLIYVTMQINLSYTQSIKQFQYLLKCLALWITFSYYKLWGFPGGASGKEPACNAGDTRDVGLFPRSGKSPGGPHSNLFQYSRLENPMDRGAWRATVHGVTESDMSETI